MGDHDDIFSELARYDDEYRPEQPVQPGIDKLADGDHDFEVLDVDLSRTAKSKEIILRLSLRANGGMVLEHTYFFGSQLQINKLGCDLCSLGFIEFRKPASFTATLKASLPKLIGVKFRAHKSTDRNGKDNKVYHNLLIMNRVSGGSGPSRPATSTPPPGPKTKPPAAPPAPPADSDNDDSIPF